MSKSCSSRAKSVQHFTASRFILNEVNETNPAIGASLRAREQLLFSLLQSCNTVKQLIQIHSQIITSGFTQKNFILVKLLSIYASSGYLPLALKVFENINNPSTTCWNQIIRGHARSETPRKSIDLYNKMVAGEFEADGFTFSFLLSACTRSGSLKIGEMVHGRVLMNGYYHSNVFVRTNLVNLYANCGGVKGIESARKLFDEMGERNVVTWNSLLAGYIRQGDVSAAARTFDEMPEKNIRSWTIMVAGCAQIGDWKSALSFFHQMRRGCSGLDQVALLAALSACAEFGDLELGTWIHWYIEMTWGSKQGSLLVSLSNALIHMYSSCGVIDKAYKIFKTMPRPSTISWTTIITGLAKQGRGEEALRVFEEMLGSDEISPDEATFIAVLFACSHAGLVGEGRRVFECMKERYRISPKIEHYGCMVDLLSRAGLWSEVTRLTESMPMKPNNAIWGAILGGCRIHKNDEFASDIARNLVVEMDHGQGVGQLALLADVYAKADRWQEVAILREKITSSRKPRGRSWIQIDGVIHDFMAGDWTHKDVSLIYHMVGEITRQSREEHYELDMVEKIWNDC